MSVATPVRPEETSTSASGLRSRAFLSLVKALALTWVRYTARRSDEREQRCVSTPG